MGKQLREAANLEEGRGETQRRGAERVGGTEEAEGRDPR